MKLRFAHLCSILALLTCGSGAWALSANSQPVKTSGIAPALLAKAKAGDAEAEFYLSLRYFDLGNQMESCRWVRAAAGNGDAVAQVALATFYENGSDGSNLCAVARDYAQAAFWYRKAADQGKPGAQLALGNLYHNGQGVQRDDVQATAWYRKAAEQGDVDAQYSLGVAYLFGKGVPVDARQGMTWLRKAASQGNSTAQTDLAHIYLRGEAVPQDYSKAVYWYRIAAEHGNPDGQAALASLYEIGEGVPKSYADAYFWMSLAAANPELSGNYHFLADQDAAARDRIALHLSRTVLLDTQGRVRKWLEDDPAKPQ